MNQPISPTLCFSSCSNRDAKPALIAFPDLCRLCECGRGLSTTCVSGEKMRKLRKLWGRRQRRGHPQCCFPAPVVFPGGVAPPAISSPAPSAFLPPSRGLWPVVPVISFDFLQVGSVLSNLYIRNTFFMIITNTHHFRAIGMCRNASRNRKTTSAVVPLPRAIGI